ncbi:hypothetical protein I7I48_04662 [Histoplasma ohiense]|nr:hypothetical protein I7I48_04662 [Histoplasma ohiense (nom. inval.)]
MTAAGVVGRREDFRFEIFGARVAPYRLVAFKVANGGHVYAQWHQRLSGRLSFACSCLKAALFLFVFFSFVVM